MGTLAGAHRDLPSEAEHRCWARRGGTLLVRVHYAKVLVKEQPQRVEAVQQMGMNKKEKMLIKKNIFHCTIFSVIMSPFDSLKIQEPRVAIVPAFCLDFLLSSFHLSFLLDILNSTVPSQFFGFFLTKFYHHLLHQCFLAGLYFGKQCRETC